MRTSWVKRNGGKDGGDWSARVRAASFSNEENPTFVSIIFYFATDYTGWIKSAKKVSSTSSILVGETEDVGKFKVKIEVAPKEDKNEKVFLDQVTGNISSVHLKESMLNNGFFDRIKLKSGNLKDYIGLKSGSGQPHDESNFIAYQVSGHLPLEFEVIYESDSLRAELEEKKNLYQLN